MRTPWWCKALVKQRPPRVRRSRAIPIAWAAAAIVAAALSALPQNARAQAQPTDVTLQVTYTATNDPCLRLEWERPAGANKIQVRYKPASATDPAFTDPIDATQEEVWVKCDLPLGRTHTVQVRAEYSGTASDWFERSVAVPPPAPANLMATELHERITLSWDALPTTAPLIRVDHYEWRMSSSDDYASISGSNDLTTSATWSGLTNGQRYSFQLRAVNSGGAGPGVWINNVTPRKSNNEPVFRDDEGNAITSASREANESVPSGSAVGAPVTAVDPEGDTLTYSLVVGSEFVPIEIDSESGQLRVRSGFDLNFESRPEIAVTVAVSDGEDFDGIAEATPTIDATIPVTITVTDDDTEAPFEFGAPMVVHGSDTALTATWNLPANNGPPINDYDLEYREQGTDDWIDLPHDGTTRTATITGLKSNTAYEVRGRANNDEGIGPWSEPGVGTTNGAELELRFEQRSYRVREGRTVTMEVRVSDAVGLTGSDRVLAIPIVTAGSTTTFATVTISRFERTGSFTFTAAQDADDKDGMVIFGFGALPDRTSAPAPNTTELTIDDNDNPNEFPVAPEGLSATPEDQVVEIGWTDPGNITITDYRVRYSTDGGTSWSRWSAIPDSAPSGANATSYTVTGLTNRQEYTFELQARNDLGAGPASSPIKATPVMPAPTGFRADPGDGATSAVLSWNDPNKRHITSYQYRYREPPHPFGAWVTIPNSGAATTGYTVSGFFNGSGYVFELRALVGDRASEVAEATVSLLHHPDEQIEPQCGTKPPAARVRGGRTLSIIGPREVKEGEAGVFWASVDAGLGTATNNIDLYAWPGNVVPPVPQIPEGTDWRYAIVAEDYSPPASQVKYNFGASSTTSQGMPMTVGTKINTAPVAGKRVQFIVVVDYGVDTETTEDDFNGTLCKLVTINTAPEVTAAAPESVTVDGAELTVDVSGWFADTDALTYSVTVAESPGVLTSVSGTALTLTPVAIGQTEIAVTATDTLGSEVTHTVTIDVRELASGLKDGWSYETKLMPETIIAGSEDGAELMVVAKLNTGAGVVDMAALSAEAAGELNISVVGGKNRVGFGTGPDARLTSDRTVTVPAKPDCTTDTNTGQVACMIPVTTGSERVHAKRRADESPYMIGIGMAKSFSLTARINGAESAKSTAPADPDEDPIPDPSLQVSSTGKQLSGWSYRTVLSRTGIRAGGTDGADLSVVATFEVADSELSGLTSLAAEATAGGELSATLATATPQRVGFGTDPTATLAASSSVTVPAAPACTVDLDNGKIDCTFALAASGEALYAHADATPGDYPIDISVAQPFTLTAVVNGADSTTSTPGANDLTDPTLRVAAADAPMADADTATTPERTAVTVDVLANDEPTGLLEITSVTAPMHGTAAITAGGVLYTPNADFQGGADDQFTYTVEDAVGRTAQATVTVSVTAVNDGPQVTSQIPDQLLILENGKREIIENLNDHFRDPEEASLTYKATFREDIATVSVVKASSATGTPKAVGRMMVTMTATDPDGEFAEQTFMVTVRMRLKDRINRVNLTLLPEVTRAVRASTRTAISTRIEEALSGAGRTRTLTLAGQPTLAEAVRANAQAFQDGTLSLAQVLGGSSFVLPLQAADDGARGGLGGLVLWGNGDWRNLSGATGAVDWDGEVLSGHLGADAQLREDLLAGLAFSYSKATFDYTDRTDGGPVSGDYDARVASVNPYLGWSPKSGVNLWATAGYGWGEIEIDDEKADGVQTSDLTMKSAAVGVNGALLADDQLIAGGTTTVQLKAEVSLAESKVEDNGELIEALTVDVHRLRLALQGSHAHSLASGGTFTPSVEFGVRHDGGDGLTGAGLEFGGALRYANPAAGLTVEGRGRVLMAHERGREEWGVSGLVQLNPGAAGRGLSLSLVPTWGQTASGVERLWAQGLTAGAAANTNTPQARLDAQIGYGLAALNGRALLTPYGSLSLAGEDSRLYRVGSRFAIGPALNLSLEGARREGATGVLDHGVMLQAEWRF